MRSVLNFSLLPICIVLSAAFIAPTSVTAQSRSSCGCNDIPYLIDQLNKINAALDALQRFEQTVNPNTTSTNEIAPEPNPTRATFRTILINAIRQSMDSVQNTQSRPGTRACVAEIENHQNSRVLAGTSSLGTPQFMNEDIAEARGVYDLMAGEILRRLNSIPRSCRPTEWFGSITAVETHQTSVTINVPAHGRYNKGSVSTTRTNTTITGTIWLNGNFQDPLSSWRVAGRRNFNLAGQMMVGCEKTGPNTVAERTISNGIHREINTTGSGSSSITVGVSESDDGRRASISFTGPEITVTDSGTQTNVSSGGCPGSDFNTRSALRGDPHNVSASAVQIEGTIFPGNPIKAGGSQTIDLLPGGWSVPDGTATHTVRVSYNLYKFR